MCPLDGRGAVMSQGTCETHCGDGAAEQLPGVSSLENYYCVERGEREREREGGSERDGIERERG